MLFSFMERTVPQGSPNDSLTPPGMYTVKYITVDANCLFRSLAYVITGSYGYSYCYFRAHDRHCVSHIHTSRLSYQSF